MKPGNKITITLERRSDGGLRVYSADVPGLRLSGRDPELVMGDVWPAVQTILSDSVCVLCGASWEPAIKNRCECGGFCTWGPAKGAQPDSWLSDGRPRPPPVPTDKEDR